MGNRSTSSCMEVNEIDKMKRGIKIAILGGYIFLMLISWYYVSNYLLDQNSIRDFMSRFGFFSPLIFLIVEIIYIIIVPIYNTPIHLISGFIYGPYLGLILNYVATTLGLFVIIILSRRYGRRLIRGLVSDKIIKKYDKLTSSKKLTPFFLFLIYVLPLFPDDEITYLLALSKLRFRYYIPAILLGNIPKAAVGFIGSNALLGIIPAILVRLIVLLIGIFYFFKHKPLYNFKKELKKIK